MLQRIDRKENVINYMNNRDGNYDPLMVSFERQIFVCASFGEPFNHVMQYEVINAVGNSTDNGITKGFETPSCLWQFTMLTSFLCPRALVFIRCM